MLNIQVTPRKNGQQQAWFRDTLGRRVGTRVGIDGGGITKAEQLAWLGNYYIELQGEQLDAGVGSDGLPMPRLSGGSAAKFDRTGGQARFVRRVYSGYQGQKIRMGLPAKRDLYGPGKDGHMRDDIRINYLDDRMVKISITRQKSRQKALANQRLAEWWGLSPESARKLAAMQAAIYGGAMADYLDRLGLVEAGNYMVQLARALNAKKRALLGRAA